MCYGNFVLSSFNEYRKYGADVPRLASESAIRYMAQHTDIHAAHPGKDSLIRLVRNVHIREGVVPNPVDSSEKMEGLLRSVRYAHYGMTADAFAAVLRSSVLAAPIMLKYPKEYADFYENISRFAMETFEETLQEVESGIYLLRQEHDTYEG
jgi:hypothetical protein